MTKYEKIILNDYIKKNAVLEILKTLNGTNISDCKEILGAVKYFVENNCIFMNDVATSKIAEISDDAIETE